MDTKRHLLLTFLLLSQAFTHFVLAQAKDPAYVKTEMIIATHLATKGTETIALEKYKNKAYCFSIALYVNSRGMVDAIQYTNVSSELDSLVSTQQMSKSFKSEKRDFAKYKNTVLVCLVFIRRNWDDTIDNVGYLDKTFSTLIPPLENLPENIKVKILPAFSMVQAKPTRG